jgi:hypothetical protein
MVPQARPAGAYDRNDLYDRKEHYDPYDRRIPVGSAGA